MRCPACGGENVDGAKFCGVCGQPMPRVTAETREIPPPRNSPLPGSSLAESIGVPASSGGRTAKIAIILALDAALAIGGVVLMTRGGGGGEAVADSAKPGSGATSGSGAASGGDTTPGGGGELGTGAGGGGAGGGGATTGSGGGMPGSGAGGGGVGGHHTGSGTGTGTGTGTSIGTGSGSDDDPISAAAAAAAAAAAGKIDAGTASPAIDAAVVAPPPIDAAPAVETPVDAADTTPAIDAPEAAASAAELAGHLARQVVQSSSKMDRCYQNATKALPDDQPLSGEVDIGLSVMPTGQVQNVRVTRNTTGSNDLGNCVQGIAAQWTFPAHNESEPVDFVHVFRFGPRTN